jgi:monofunctional glycosyltransferase
MDSIISRSTQTSNWKAAGHAPPGVPAAPFRGGGPTRTKAGLWKTAAFLGKQFASALGLVAGLAVLGGLWGGLFWLYRVPDLDVLKTQNPEATRLMTIREGQALAAGRKYRRSHQWVPLKKMSPHLAHAVVAAEDGRFYQHKGLDYEALEESFRFNIQTKKYSRGGSTITQQVAKNLFLSPQKTILRKIKEAIIARELERTLTKERILEIYLNIAEWGEGIFGAEAAARAYFRKPASALTVDEAAALTAVLPSPRRNSPRGENRFVTRRKAWVLRRLEATGYLPKSEPVEEFEWAPAAEVLEQEAGAEWAAEEQAAEEIPEMASPVAIPDVQDLPPLPAADGRRRVVLVGGEASAVDYLGSLLEARGYQTHRLVPDASLVAKARRIGPALVVVDTDFGSFNGFDVCRVLKRDDVLGPTPVVMLVSRDRAGDANRAFAAGADDYVTKPFETESIVKKLRGYAER